VSEYGPLQYDDAHRLEIIDKMREVFKSGTLDRWEAELTGLDVCYGTVRNMDEVFSDPLFREREMIVDLKSADGSTEPVLGVPVKLADTPGSVRTAPVEFGASTEIILREIGYSGEQIAGFADKGVV